jgi:hypothetical protein
MSLFTTTLAAAVAGLSLLAPSAPSGDATATTVDLSRPGDLERGDDVRIPHVEGTEIVDGDVRVDLGTERFQLMGASGDDYIVHRWTQRFGRDRVVRVTAEGDRTVLVRGEASWGAVLSSDGVHVITNDNNRRATLTAYDAADGSLVGSARFGGYGYVLDAEGGTAVVSAWGQGRAVSWDFVDGGRTVVAEKDAYLADIAADRLAVFTGDPYEDGCTEVSTLSAPDETVWRSCRQKVATFSPDGARMMTMHILSDGLGPGEVDLRSFDGTRLVTYASRWFGELAWEDTDTVLLDANGRRNGATVRCDLDVCELASDVAPTSP